MPQIQIHIRKAVAADSRCIAAMGRETFADSFGPDNRPQDMADYLERSFSSEIQVTELAQPSACFLIAEAGEQPVGYAHLLEAPAPACIEATRPMELKRFYARKACIGRGVGAALMRASIGEARHRPCDGIWLGVWEKNDRAIRFYRRWGFTRKGTQTFVLGHDRQTDLVLWLPLDASLNNEKLQIGMIR